MQITAFCNKHLNLRHLLCLPVCCSLCPHDIFGSISVNFNFYSDCTSILPHSALFPRTTATHATLWWWCVRVCVCVYVPVCLCFAYSESAAMGVSDKVHTMYRRLAYGGDKIFILHSVAEIC